MGFNDFWINNNGKKEHLNNAKHGVRKEQVDKKFHNLFDAYDANSDGTLESEELGGVFKGLTKFAGADKTLDATENKQVASLFANQAGIENADFMGFVRSVSKATEDIVDSKTTPTADGGREVTTTYKDGSIETISYYPDGEYKFKKLDQKATTTTNFYTVGDNLNKKYTAAEIEGRVKKAYQQKVAQIKASAEKNKPVEGRAIAIIPDYNQFKQEYMQRNRINQGSHTHNFERHDFELSERGKQDVAVRDFVLSHYIDTHKAAQEALESMGILDDVGAAINAGAGELWNSIKNVWNGTEEEYQNFYELSKKFEPNYNKALRESGSLDVMRNNPEMFFRGFETDFKKDMGHKYNLENSVQFQQTAEQYQNAQILKQRIDILNKAMQEVRMYQSEQDALVYAPAQNEGLNPASHIVSANKLLLQYFNNDQEAVDMILNGTIGNADATIKAISGIKEDTEKLNKAVLDGKTFDQIQDDYKSQYKAMYGTDFVPDELTEKVMDAKATGGMVKLAAITIVSILITKSPIMAEISGAAAGSAEATGAAANLVRTLVAKYGQTAVQQGIKLAMTSGTLATDVGLTLINQATSERGVNGEELWESTKGSAKYIFFGAYVGAPMAQAVSRSLGKIGATSRLFEGGTKTANGAIQTTSISGDKLIQNFVKGGNKVLTTGGAFLTDVAAFTGLEVATEGANLKDALSEQGQMLSKLKLMNHVLEYMLGAKAHTATSRANLDAAIEKSGVKNWNIKEIKTPQKTQYIVDIDGLPVGKFEDANQLATAMIERVSANYNESAKPQTRTQTTKPEGEVKTNPEIEGETEITRVDNTNSRERILEGGVKGSELTEVAPFARHLAPHSVTDAFRILAEDLDERANKVNFDLAKYEKTGFPLKYSRQEFTQRLKDLVNNMPIEAQREILKKFNIELNYTGDSFELRDVPKIPRDIKNPLEFAIKTEIERFTKENEIEIDNPEVKVFLDDFIKLAPEFLFIVGKKQHETHAYTVDVHTIKVLQNAIEHPEYKNLSAEDKMVLNTAILLHDIAKQFVDTKTPDDSHAEYGYKYAIKILDRFNLSNDIKQRIVKLIRNHEFFKSYNNAYIPFKAEAKRNEQERQDAEKYGYKFSPRNDYTYNFNSQVKYNAGQFLNILDFRLAKILTSSDLKSVNPDKTFIKEEWNRETRENEPVEYQGFEKFVTGTHSDAEFKEYLDESLSYIEKELQKYDGGKIDDEFVYETELAETSLKLFGSTGFFDSISRNFGQNQPYAVHRSDFNMIIQARQRLLDAGVKKKEVENVLRNLIKTDGNQFSPEVTSEFIKVYLENKDFIDSHDIKLGGAYSSDLRNAEMLQKKIAHIKEKESIAKIFKKYNVKDEWMQKRLVDSLYTKEYDKYEPVFVKEAQDAMFELFDMKKFTPEEIQNIIFNSFSKKDHRGIFRENDNSSSLFNRQIFDTILEFSKEESLDNAIQDTHLCFVNPTPESGWVIAPEILASVKELNKMGIKDKGFIRSTFDIKYKDGKNKYDNTRVIESITKNELYEKAIKYSKQGFNAGKVDIIINSFEIENGKVIYPEHIQDKIANLVKLGVYNNRNEWIKRTLFDEEQSFNSYNLATRKLNEANYNFIVNMLNKGIPPEILDNMFYQSLCQTYEAEKAAPDKMVETGKFSKAQVEAMVDFFKEIGFDKAPRFSTDDMYHDLAECFMDIVELTSKELEGMCVYSSYFDRMMPMPKMSEGMAPFRVVNKEKFNQALDYYKKGVSISNLKHLTETPELYKELKNEADLSFIKTENDADLVSTFWKMKDVKSINELSKQERIQFMNELMMHKSEIEGNNVSDKISILPKDSQGYSDMMKNIADSFGLNNEPYTQQKVSQINKSFSDISARLLTIKPSEIETDNSINRLVNEITSVVSNLNKENISSILLTLQRVVKSPEYQTLSKNDKKLMNIAVIFSKVDSTSNNPFDSAIDAFATLLNVI